MVLALCEEWWVLTTVKTSFPFSQQIPSEVLKQCAKGIQTGDLGASPHFPSPDTLERKLGNCIGVWWSRSRTTLTLTPSPLLFNRPHPQIHSNLLYLPWIRLDFWSRILTVFLVFLVRLIMGISAYLDLWDVAFLEKIYMHIKPWDREPSFSSSWPLNREPLLKLTNWHGKGGVRHNLSLEPQVLEVLCVPSFLFFMVDRSSEFSDMGFKRCWLKIKQGYYPHDPQRTKITPSGELQMCLASLASLYEAHDGLRSLPGCNRPRLGLTRRTSPEDRASGWQDDNQGMILIGKTQPLHLWILRDTPLEWLFL